MQLNHNFIPMGKIVGAFGILGWIKVKVDTQDVTSLVNYTNPYLLIDGTWVPTKFEKYSTQNGILQIKLKGVNDRDQAIALKGVLIGVARDEFPKLGDDEYYWTDLIGISVFNLNNENLGVITSLMETGANDVLVINDGKTEHLIPFVDRYIKTVELAQRKLIVDWETDY